MCLAIVLALLLTAPTRPDPWLVVPGGRVGLLTARTHHGDLAKFFGAKNVKDTMRSMGGDAEEQPATIIYPDRPDQELVIFWIGTSAEATRIARDQTIDAVDLCPGRHRCKWRLAGGLSLGSTLKQLENLNGGPFDLYGFDWDYSGTVADWHGGKLTPLLHGCSRVIVRLDVAEPLSPALSADYERMAGDRILSSRDPAMQRVSPAAYQITVGLAKDDPCVSTSDHKSPPAVRKADEAKRR